MRSLNIRFGRLARFAVVAIALSVIISSCRSRNRDQTQSSANSPISIENLSNNQKLVENEPKGIRITIPSSWETVESLRADADIYTANEPDNMYVLVLADDRSTTVEEFDLSDNASQYRRVLARQLDGFDDQTATSVTSVNGQPAEQYEIRGEIDDTPIVYIHTTIRGDENYYQVIGWTRADQYDARREELQQVITSFKGV